MMKGSGRKKMNKKMPASRNAAAYNMNGPASSGTPTDSAKLPMTSTRFGPATPPNIVENIAKLTHVPRCSFVKRTVLAYQAVKLFEVPAPNIKSERNKHKTLIIT